MIRYNTSMFSKTEKDYILSKYLQSNNLDELLKETPYSKTEIVAILLANNIKNQSLISTLNIPNLQDNQLIIISDTHLGSKLDNLNYIYKAYDYALSNNIKTIIHLGDLFQSTMRNVSPSYIEPSTQLQLFLTILKSYPSIDTYILFGNHDLHLLKKDDTFLKELNNYNNLKILGFKKSYLSWQNTIISLHHPISKYNLNIPSIIDKIKLYGHRHQLYLKDNQIYLPSLSDDLKTYSNIEGTPGFLIATLKDNKISFEYLEFIPKMTSKGLIYQQKIR